MPRRAACRTSSALEQTEETRIPMVPLAPGKAARDDRGRGYLANNEFGTTTAYTVRIFCICSIIARPRNPDLTPVCRVWSQRKAREQIQGFREIGETQSLILLVRCGEKLQANEARLTDPICL